ncbi:hypothetical protein AAVH_01901 [Aphelenchoides avenae]|nr:hypothetical protein AAVH_01901 [Aphelenchus avenae]
MLRPQVAKNVGEILTKANTRAIAMSTCRYGDEKSILEQVRDTAGVVTDKFLDAAATTVDKTKDLGNVVADTVSQQLKGMRGSTGAKEIKETEPVAPIERAKASQVSSSLDSLTTEQREHHDAVYQMSQDMVDATKDHESEYEFKEIAARNASQVKHGSRLM